MNNLLKGLREDDLVEFRSELLKLSYVILAIFLIPIIVALCIRAFGNEEGNIQSVGLFLFKLLLPMVVTAFPFLTPKYASFRIFFFCWFIAAVVLLFYRDVFYHYSLFIANNLNVFMSSSADHSVDKSGAFTASTLSFLSNGILFLIGLVVTCIFKAIRHFKNRRPKS